MSRAGWMLLATLCVCIHSVAAATDKLGVIDGPIDAYVERVMDSDTFEMRAFVFPELVVFGQLRVDGVDSPETYGKCAYETELAASAKAFVVSLFEANDKMVKLYTIGLKGSNGGGFGRYRARVKVGGRWLDEALIQNGFARDYHGGRRLPWCPAP